MNLIKNDELNSVDAQHDTETAAKQQLFHSSYQRQIKRESLHRVFVNRTLDLSKIKFFGFELDHTLAVYKSPQYETLAFNLVIDQLLRLGYPKEIAQFTYDPHFPVRGLWYDHLYGNLLKVDTYGNILLCARGFKVLNEDETHEFYPNEFLMYDESRVYVLDAMFCLPEIHLIASLVNFFTSSPKYEQNKTGVRTDNIFVSFKAIFQDVRTAIRYVQGDEGAFKKIVLENLNEYIAQDDGSLVTLFDRMHENEVQIFLLTNSEYDFTNKVMNYLLENSDRDWRLFFDYIVVDAKKPLFFAEGTSLKEIDSATGKVKLGTHSGPLKQHQVYLGGSSDVFSKLIGSRGKDVLFVGAYVFGDIIKSKKERAWRTFLIVPELAREITIWHDKRDVFANIERLHNILSEELIDLDSSSKTSTSFTTNIHAQIQESIKKMDLEYGILGSLFRSRLRQTHFASQVTRYADIYSASHLNLLHYPFFYLFKATPMLMSHESTVNPNDYTSDAGSYSMENRLSRMDSTPKLERGEAVKSLVANVTPVPKEPLIRPETPSALTQYVDFDEEDLEPILS